MLRAAYAMTHTHICTYKMYAHTTHLYHMHTHAELLQPHLFNLLVRIPLIVVIAVKVKTEVIHGVQTLRPGHRYRL